MNSLSERAPCEHIPLGSRLGDKRDRIMFHDDMCMLSIPAVRSLYVHKAQVTTTVLLCAGAGEPVAVVSGMGIVRGQNALFDLDHRRIRLVVMVDMHLVLFVGMTTATYGAHHSPPSYRLKPSWRTHPANAGLEALGSCPRVHPAGTRTHTCHDLRRRRIRGNSSAIRESRKADVAAADSVGPVDPVGTIADLGEGAAAHRHAQHASAI